MKKLNKSIIMKEQRFAFRIFNSFLFFTIGVVVTIMPLFYIKPTDPNAIANIIIGICVCFLCFGLPLGVFFGLRRLIPALQQKTALSKGNFKICVDKVKSMRMLNEGVKSDKGDYYCQLKFEKYSNITSEYYTISRRLFNKTKEGDEFFLVYIGNIKKTISIFPRKEYELDDELKQYLTD